MSSGAISNCCVLSCESTTRNSYLFQIPRNDKMQELWLQALLPYNSQLENMSKYNRLKEQVCHKHFEKEFLGHKGKTLLGGWPTLFTENEIVHGVPLVTEADKVKGDHTYSKPYNIPTEKPTTSKLGQPYADIIKTEIKFEEDWPADCEQVYDEDSVKEEVVLLDYQQLEDLQVGPMAPLVPLLDRKVQKQNDSTKKKKYIQKKTKMIDKGPLECEFCKKVFPVNHLLVKHRRLHTRPYVCDICNRSFSQVGTLSKHKQTHNDDRPYMCNYCGKDFKYKWYFKEHLRIHDEDQHLMCEICSKKFVNHPSLWMHIRSHHTANNTCDVCNEEFPSYYRLQKHKMTHTGEPSYKCSLCGSTYSTKSYLRLHLLKHKYD